MANLTEQKKALLSEAQQYCDDLDKAVYAGFCSG